MEILPPYVDNLGHILLLAPFSFYIYAFVNLPCLHSENIYCVLYMIDSLQQFLLSLYVRVAPSNPETSFLSS